MTQEEQLILDQQLKINWLRKVHFIDVSIRQIQKDGRSYWKVTKIETDDKIKGYSNFESSPEIATEKALLTALNLIK